MAPRPPIRDIIVTISVMMRIFVLDVPFLLARYTYHHLTGRTKRCYHGVPLGKLVQLLIIRNITTYTPITFTRYVTDLGLPDKIMTWPRYAPYANRLFQPIDKGNFRGFWTIRNGFNTSDPDPSHSDIVIYYLHGGGYHSNSPASYLLFLLRIAETILRAGKTVSIFELEYDLAPEAGFPVQVTQARRGYDWLTRDKTSGGMGIDKSRLIIMGDSAGGHLSLSLVVDLWRPFSADTRDINVDSPNDPKSCLGLVLLSPWLRLVNKPESFKRNAYTDILSQEFALYVGGSFIDLGKEHARTNEETAWHDWADAKGAVSWNEVLPDWTWVSAGTNEILYDDIVRWVRDREVDCPPVKPAKFSPRIESEFAEAEPHDYAWFRMVDEADRKSFCSKPLGDGKGTEDWDAIERTATVIVRRWETVFGHVPKSR